MLNDYILAIENGQSLTIDESYQATLALLSEQTKPEQIIRYLKLLHQKGETAAEILGVIKALQPQMIEVPITRPTLDIVGTGGDGSNSINISTGAAILAASCGVPVVKHGNRASSSAVGSADVLEALGIDIEMGPEKVVASLETLNIAFCFAPRFHPALIKLRDVRRQIGTRTIFNLVGPLLNPARTQHYVMGVANLKLLQPFADTLTTLKVKKSAVVHGDGLDELTCSGTTQVIEIDQGKQKAFALDPGELGFVRCDNSALKGGDAAYNAKALIDVLNGKSGAVADTIVLNAAMGVYLYGKVGSLMDGVKLCRESLLSKKALKLLKQWITFSNTSRSAHHPVT